MKTLLAVLLSFLMAEMPAFALQGGYTLGGSGDLAGTYAGVLIPTSEQAENGFTNTFGNNDLGLFLLNIPAQGLATGSVAIFSGGVTFEGTIMALPDPKNTSGIRGVINATYNNNETVGVAIDGVTGQSAGITDSTVVATAAGQISATVSTVQNTATTVSDGVTLTGSATVEVAQNANSNGFFFFGISGTNGTQVSEIATFSVDGFQQSASYTQSNTTLNNATTTPGG